MGLRHAAARGLGRTGPARGCAPESGSGWGTCERNSPAKPGQAAKGGGARNLDAGSRFRAGRRRASPEAPLTAPQTGDGKGARVLLRLATR